MTKKEKRQRHYFADKSPSSQTYGFSSSYVWMWQLDPKEDWAPENWCFWTVVFEKILKSPLDCKEIKPVNPKENQSWIFIERTDAEAPILWPPDGKEKRKRKDLMLGMTEGRRRRGQQRTRWLDGITSSMDMSLSKFQEMVDREAWYTAIHWVTKRHDWVTELKSVAHQDLLSMEFSRQECWSGLPFHSPG